MITCPTPTPPLSHGFVSDVRFAGDGTSVYFISDRCGQAYGSAYRFSMTTRTSTVVLRAYCGWNAASWCLDDLQPNAAGDFAATRAEQNGTQSLFVNGNRVPGIASDLLQLCGISGDGTRVSFRADPDLLPGSTDSWVDIYTWNRTTATLTRTATSAGCTTHSASANSHEITFNRGSQVYIRPTT